MSEMDLDVDNLDLDGDIGLGDDDRKKLGNQVDFYKGEKGRTDRVALVYFSPLTVLALRAALQKNPSLTADQKKKVIAEVTKKRAEQLGKAVEALDEVDMLHLGEARFKAVTAVYKQGLGYLEVPRNLSPADKKVWDKVGDKKEYVMTLLAKYPTDREGNVLKEALRDGMRIIPARFPVKIYDQIRKINRAQGENNLSASAIDLSITCEDTQYQKLTFTAMGPCLYQKNAEFQRSVLEKALALYDKLSPFRQMSTDELRDKLGLGGGAASSGGMSADTLDMSNVLDNI